MLEITNYSTAKIKIKNVSGGTTTEFLANKTDVTVSMGGGLLYVSGTSDESVSFNYLIDYKQTVIYEEVKHLNIFSLLNGIIGNHSPSYSQWTSAQAVLNTLGTASTKSTEYFATASQGGKADTALQDASAFATAAQGAKADKAPSSVGSALTNTVILIANLKKRSITIDGITFSVVTID